MTTTNDYPYDYLDSFSDDDARNGTERDVQTLMNDVIGIWMTGCVCLLGNARQSYISDLASPSRWQAACVCLLPVLPLASQFRYLDDRLRVSAPSRYCPWRVSFGIWAIGCVCLLGNARQSCTPDFVPCLRMTVLPLASQLRYLGGDGLRVSARRGRQRGVVCRAQARVRRAVAHVPRAARHVRLRLRLPAGRPSSSPVAIRARRARARPAVKPNLQDWDWDQGEYFGVKTDQDLNFVVQNQDWNSGL